MAIKLGSNIDSLAAESALNQFTSSLSKSYERLSSGLRINQASDDAAGLSIVSQLNSHARVFTQAIRNVNDGVSAASIAEGALSALKTISQRQLELSEEAANGTYSIKQRGALNTEANALVDEYNRIVSTTTFNGLSLLYSSLGTVLIQAGYGQTGALQLNLSNQLARPVQDGTFNTAATYQSAGGLTGSRYLVQGDLNGDGKLDIVTEDYSASDSGGDITVLLGNGDGTFKAEQTYQVGGIEPHSIALADLNGDGVLDVVTGDVQDGDVSIFFGNGNGTFKAAQTIQVPSGDNATLGDVNGDGISDIIASSNNTVDIFVGNGDGTFKATRSFQTFGGGIPGSLNVGDMNGDGKLDVLTTNYGYGGFGVLLGNGNGTFGAPQSFAATATTTASISTGDVNGDGKSDVVTTDYYGNVGVYLGNGNGTFQAERSFSTGAPALSVALSDLNSDGRLDIVTSMNGSSSPFVNVFTGNGDGSFASPTSYAAGGAGIVLGDFNGDGRTDIAAGDLYADSSVSVLLARGAFASTIPYLNIDTQQGARDALNTVTANLNRVEAQLGAIGATTSRFQVELGNLQTETENFDAAAGRIQDTDVAQETANLTRTQILQQAAASVLAQANQEPGLALKLLGG